MMNYFLWRDRKGAINNFLSFFAMLVMIQLTLLALYQRFWPDAWHFCRFSPATYGCTPCCGSTLA